MFVYSKGQRLALPFAGWTEAEGQRLCKDLNCGRLKSNSTISTSNTVFWNGRFSCEGVKDPGTIWDCEKPASPSPSPSQQQQQQQQLTIECEGEASAILLSDVDRRFSVTSQTLFLSAVKRVRCVRTGQLRGHMALEPSFSSHVTADERIFQNVKLSKLVLQKCQINNTPVCSFSLCKHVTN